MASSFTVFGIVLYPYSLCMIVGAGVCIGLFSLLTVKRHAGRGRENAFAIEMLLVAVAAALPAAILFDALFKWWETGELAVHGATFYGGLIGALALWPVLLLFGKKRTVPVYERLCDLAPAIPAGHFFGRIGCFLGGCCFGSPTDGPFGVVFPQGSIPYEHYGGAVAIHPTQLYEAAALLLLFVLLFFCVPRRFSFPCYFIGYGIGRFVIEFFRADDRGALPYLPLSPAQTVSVVLVLLGAALLAVQLHKLATELKRRKSL